MDFRHAGLAGLTAALLATASGAYAGGFERSSQDFDILFEQGTVAEAGATFVAPQRKLKNIGGSYIATQTGGINPMTGKPFETSVKETVNYWVPKFSAKYDITNDLACAAQYRQPWGIDMDVGTGTVRQFTAITQKISSHDLGINCSYRFAVGEKAISAFWVVLAIRNCVVNRPRRFHLLVIRSLEAGVSAHWMLMTILLAGVWVPLMKFRNMRCVQAWFTSRK